MSKAHKDVGFTFDSKDLERTKHFNIDGGKAIHVDVWVESYDDQRFWLAHFPRNLKFKFFPKSPDKKRGRDNKVSTGCDRLFKLERTGVIKLGVSQIFCLDSDDSHLKAALPGYSSPKRSRPHVYATNVYSLENVVLHPDLLDRTFETVTGTSVASLKTKPSEMLALVSTLSHDVLLLVAYYEVVLRTAKDGKKYKERFLTLLGGLCKFDPRLQNTGCQTFKIFVAGLKDIRVEIEAFIALRGKSAGFDSYKKHSVGTGYTPETSYLFARGHNLYDSIIESLTAVSDAIREIEIKSLKAKFEDYEDRVRCLEAQWPNFDHALKAAYLAALPDVAFFRECRSRILADYS